MKTQLRLLEAFETDRGERVWRESTLPRRWSGSRAIAGLSAGLLLFAGLVFGRPSYQRPAAKLVRVKVTAGDTLWSLARRHGHPQQYLPETIHEIRQSNRLSSSVLTPGQEIVVPVHAPAQLSWRSGAVLAHSGR